MEIMTKNVKTKYNKQNIILTVFFVLFILIQLFSHLTFLGSFPLVKQKKCTALL